MDNAVSSSFEKAQDVLAQNRSTITERPMSLALKTDPRTKLLMILLCALTTFFAPTVAYEALLVLYATVFGIVSGKRKYPLVMAGVYAFSLAVMFAASSLDLGVLQTMVLSFFLLLRKVFPCAILAGIMLSTTKVGEFMTAMARLRLPRQIVIPLAVMVRYVPVVREDWRFVHDAMKLRGISPGPVSFVRNPMRTIECIYVPLMMGACNASDDLAIAAIARGVENPEPRTCFAPISFRVFDGIALAVSCVLLAGAVFL